MRIADRLRASPTTGRMPAQAVQALVAQVEQRRPQRGCQAEIVSRVIDAAQQGDQVLDLRSVVVAAPADRHVGQAGGFELCLIQRQLRGCPEQDRRVAVFEGSIAAQLPVVDRHPVFPQAVQSPR